VHVVRGLSQRPNLTEGPAATWDSRKKKKYFVQKPPFFGEIMIKKNHKIAEPARMTTDVVPSPTSASWGRFYETVLAEIYGESLIWL
jgi:hypothetical protein